MFYNTLILWQTKNQFSHNASYYSKLFGKKEVRNMAEGGQSEAEKEAARRAAEQARRDAEAAEARRQAERDAQLKAGRKDNERTRTSGNGHKPGKKP